MHAVATLSARSAQVVETGGAGGCCPTCGGSAELDELHPWDQTLLSSARQRLHTTPQPVRSQSITQRRLLRKREEITRPVPWKPSNIASWTRSTSNIASWLHATAESGVLNGDEKLPSHGRLRKILLPCSPRAQDANTDGASLDVTQKKLYWSEPAGLFGNEGASMEALASSLSGTSPQTMQAADDSALARHPVPVLPPAWEIWGYKLVAKVGSRFFSLWAGEHAEYQLGLSAADEALSDRRGGLYICDSPASAARQYIATSLSSDELCVALLRCSCRGPFIDYGGGKAACSSLTPCAEVSLALDAGSGGPAAGLWDRLHSTPCAGMPGAAHSDGSGRKLTMPGWDVVGYTVAARMGQPPLRERHFCLWSLEAFRYDLGIPTRDEALMDPFNDHLLVVRSQEEVPSVHIAIAEKLRRSGIGSAPRVLLRCSCEGPFLELSDGRVACSKVTPLEEMPAPAGDWQVPEFVPPPPAQSQRARASPRVRISAAMHAAQSMQPQLLSRPRSSSYHGRRTPSQR